MRRKAHAAHGVSPCEQEILSLADAGVPAAEIARRLGKDQGYIRKITSLYEVSAKEEMDWRARARRADAAFLAALKGARFDQAAGNVRSASIGSATVELMAAAIAAIPSRGLPAVPDTASVSFAPRSVH